MALSILRFELIIVAAQHNIITPGIHLQYHDKQLVFSQNAKRPVNVCTCTDFDRLSLHSYV
jgi:hypothetical protein